MTEERLVLASASPRRHELLAALGVPFEVAPADLDESLEGDPLRAAEALALRKARAVADREPGAIILGADTLVILDGHALGKPADAAEAGAMLEALRGRWHEVATGVAVVTPRGQLSRLVRTRVQMREYDPGEVDRYVASGEALDKAGAYAVQDPEFRPAAAVDGCLCSVIGLPLWTTRRLLDYAGLEVRAPAIARCAICPLADPV